MPFNLGKRSFRGPKKDPKKLAAEVQELEKQSKLVAIKMNAVGAALYAAAKSTKRHGYDRKLDVDLGTLLGNMGTIIDEYRALSKIITPNSSTDEIK